MPQMMNMKGWNLFLNINNWIDPNLETIIGGAFNCAINAELDRKTCSNSRDIG